MLFVERIFIPWAWGQSPCQLCDRLIHCYFLGSEQRSFEEMAKKAAPCANYRHRGQSTVLGSCHKETLYRRLSFYRLRSLTSRKQISGRRTEGSGANKPV
jgi:hypothetical protein